MRSKLRRSRKIIRKMFGIYSAIILSLHRIQSSFMFLTAIVVEYFMATQKKYRLDLLETLKGLHPGESVVFTIAGEGSETTYSSLHSTKRNYKLPITIVMSDDHMTATVTRNE